MSPAALLAPVFAHVALVFAVAAILVVVRNAAAARGEVDLVEAAADNRNWPANTRKVEANYANNLQFPILFHVCMILLLVTSLGDGISVALAWIFVASRVAHSAIHIGANPMRPRSIAFSVGVAAVAALWVWFAIRLYGG